MILRTLPSFSVWFLVPLLAAGLACGPSGADEHGHPPEGARASVDDPGHDHAGGDAQHASSDARALEPLSVTLFGEHTLLFMEFPPLVRDEPARFLAHFTVLDTGEPVRSGRVVLEIGATLLTADAPARDGLFIPEGRPGEPGRWPSRLTLTSAQGDETFALGDLVVHPSTDAARAASGPPGDEPAGAVAFLLEQQWKVQLQLARAEPARLVRRWTVPARVLSAEGARASVTTPVAGRLLAPDAGTLPRSGDTVTSGQVLAWIEPLLQPTDAAQWHALRVQWEMQALAVGRERAEAAAHLRFAESERARIAALLPDGLAARSDAERAERDVSLARAALDVAEQTQQSLERMSGDEPHPAGATGAPRMPLRAPIAGVVTTFGHAVGESLEAGDPLLDIVDVHDLCIEGLVSEFDLARLGGSFGAVASFPALPDVRIELGGDGASGDGGDSAHPVHAATPRLGVAVDASTRTLTVRYDLPRADARLRPGMLAELELALEVVDAPVVIPYEAVVMDQGLPTAYVMLSGELFERRDLRLGLRDGERVEVLAGLAPSERVATRGASMIRLASLDPATFGAGHSH